MVDEEHGQIIIEELGKAVAETQQPMEQLADARAEVGDPTSADELRSMARRLVELGRGGWRDPMRTMPPQPPRLERSMLDNERAGGSVIAIPDDARPPAAELTLRGCRTVAEAANVSHAVRRVFVTARDPSLFRPATIRIAAMHLLQPIR